MVATIVGTYVREAGQPNPTYIPAGTDHATLSAAVLQQMSNPQLWAGGAVPAGALPPSSVAGDPLALELGEGNMSRANIGSTGVPMSNGQVRLAYFTATKTEDISQVLVLGGGVAAVTPTLIRVAVYEVDAATRALTLVGATANSTTLFAATNTAYTRALTAPFRKTAGKRYAAGALVVGAATVPNVGGVNYNAAAALVADLHPRLTAARAGGQTDLPASITDAELVASTVAPFVLLLP